MKHWDDYRLILAVHRTGSVRGAAKALGVNHATVSRRLAQLPNRNGMQPFERVTGGYQATEAGKLMVAAAEQIETILLTTERQRRASVTELAGPIRLSLPTMIAQTLLLDAIAEFSRQYPYIQLQIDTSLGFADLDRSEADVVVRGSAEPGDHLVGQRLFPYAVCGYCAPDYLKQTAPADRRWLRYTGGHRFTDWIARSPYPEAPIAMQVDDLIVLQRAAAAGHGMIRTACYMADTDPALMRIPGTEPEAARDLWVLTHPDLKRRPRIRHLMQFLIAKLRQQQPLITGTALAA